MQFWWSWSPWTRLGVFAKSSTLAVLLRGTSTSKALLLESSGMQLKVPLLTLIPKPEPQWMQRSAANLDPGNGESHFGSNGYRQNLGHLKCTSWGSALVAETDVSRSGSFLGTPKMKTYTAGWNSTNVYRIPPKNPLQNLIRWRLAQRIFCGRWLGVLNHLQTGL